jgi:hypothetical protein
LPSVPPTNLPPTLRHRASVPSHVNAIPRLFLLFEPRLAPHTKTVKNTFETAERRAAVSCTPMYGCSTRNHCQHHLQGLGVLTPSARLERAAPTRNPVGRGGSTCLNVLPTPSPRVSLGVTRHTIALHVRIHGKAPTSRMSRHRASVGGCPARRDRAPRTAILQVERPHPCVTRAGAAPGPSSGGGSGSADAAAPEAATSDATPASWQQHRARALQRRGWRWSTTASRAAAGAHPHRPWSGRAGASTRC